jgi:thiol-disulfide isomerase/thioredoxin
MAAMERREFAVTCLCAEWCDVCREYRPAFLALAGRFPQARFAWLDIEDDADKIGDIEIEDFPTLRVERGGAVLFQGVLLPKVEHLARVLEKLLSGENS